MIRKVAVMPGRGSFNLKILHTVARDFGWPVEVVEDMGRLTVTHENPQTTAVLLHRTAFESRSWPEALLLVGTALPGIRLITCQEFSDLTDWPELSEAGAFHSLRLPMKEEEVRQSFGFVAEAESREARMLPRFPMVIPARHTNRAQSSRHLASSAAAAMASHAI